MSQSTHIVKQNYRITRADREKLLGQHSVVIWLTGLSGSGKSTIADLLEQELSVRGIHTYLLDGDNVRHGLSNNVGFDMKGRQENIRRIGEVSKLFYDAGTVVICAFVSPFRSDRDLVRTLLPSGDFIEVYVECPLEICEQRDVKGLYAKARTGEIADFTGISSPFEEPLNPELTVHTSTQSLSDCVNLILKTTLKRIKSDQE